MRERQTCSFSLARAGAGERTTLYCLDQVGRSNSPPCSARDGVSPSGVRRSVSATGRHSAAQCHAMSGLAGCSLSATAVSHTVLPDRSALNTQHLPPAVAQGIAAQVGCWGAFGNVARVTQPCGQWRGNGESRLGSVVHLDTGDWAFLDMVGDWG